MCTLHGLPIMFALTGAKADERETALGMFDVESELVAARPGQALIGDKNHFGGNFERHRGRTPAGVMVRVLQRILALTAAIRHNDQAGQPTMRSLTAYDH